jgi:hypothetical protein
MAASVVLFMAGWYGSQWWTKPELTSVVVVQQPEVTNPWVLAAYAQSVTGRGPMFPTPFVVQGAMIEMLTEGKGSLNSGASAGQDSASPGRVAPQGEQLEPTRLPLLPIIQRL